MKRLLLDALNVVMRILISAIGLGLIFILMTGCSASSRIIFQKGAPTAVIKDEKVCRKKVFEITKSKARTWYGKPCQVWIEYAR